MKFNVKKAEAVYTGGGIYVFGGITKEGLHFIASDDPEWVMLTESPTMTDELTNEEWNDMWYCEWQEDHEYYSTQTTKEARKWLIKIYDNILKNPDFYYCHRDIKLYRSAVLSELDTF